MILEESENFSFLLHRHTFVIFDIKMVRTKQTARKSTERKKIKRFYSKPEIWFDLLPCECMDDKKEKMIECCFSLRTLFWKYLIE